MDCSVGKTICIVAELEPRIAIKDTHATRRSEATFVLNYFDHDLPNSRAVPPRRPT
jgi:hypothetical protein